MKKKYLLWIRPNGDPVYVQFSDPVTLEAVDQLRMQWDEVRKHNPVVLGPEWEIRILTE